MEILNEGIKTFVNLECDECKKSIKKIEEYLQQLGEKKEVYCSMFIRGPKRGHHVRHIILRPEFDTSGNITAYHIELSEEE